jgi:flagellar FliL protein
MAAKEKAPEGDDEDKKDGEGETPEGGEAPKQGLVKKILGNKLLLIGVAVGALLLLGGAGGGVWWFFLRTPPAPKVAANMPVIPPVPPSVAFFDVPDILVNLQTADGSAAYLKLSVALELDSDLEKPGLQVLMPRLVDQFQSYLRELRLDDLKGSAGVMRLKEELLRRVNASAAPYHVRDVLLKEMIVQ